MRRISSGPQPRLPAFRRSSLPLTAFEPEVTKAKPPLLGSLRLGQLGSRRVLGPLAYEELLPLWEAGVLPRLRPGGGEGKLTYFQRCLNTALPLRAPQEWSLQRTDKGETRLCLTANQGRRLEARATWNWLEALHPHAGYTVLHALREALPGCWSAIDALEHIENFYWDMGFPPNKDRDEDDGITAGQVEAALGNGVCTGVPLRDEALRSLTLRNPAFARVMALLSALRESRDLPGGKWEEGEAIHPWAFITDPPSTENRDGLVAEMYEEAHSSYMQSGEEPECFSFPLKPAVLLKLGEVLRLRSELIKAFWEAVERFEVKMITSE